LTTGLRKTTAGRSFHPPGRDEKKKEFPILKRYDPLHQRVNEVSKEPDYDEVLKAVKEIAG
jgi:hypothetical protein